MQKSEKNRKKSVFTISYILPSIPQSLMIAQCPVFVIEVVVELGDPAYSLH